MFLCVPFVPPGPRRLLANLCWACCVAEAVHFGSRMVYDSWASKHDGAKVTNRLRALRYCSRRNDPAELADRVELTRQTISPSRKVTTRRLSKRRFASPVFGATIEEAFAFPSTGRRLGSDEKLPSGVVLRQRPLAPLQAMARRGILQDVGFRSRRSGCAGPVGRQRGEHHDVALRAGTATARRVR